MGSIKKSGAWVGTATLALSLGVAFLTSPAQAFTLEISGNATDSGWPSNNITVDYDPTCANNSAVQNALSAAATLWSSVPASNLSVSVGSSRSLGSAITTYTGSNATQSYVGNPLVYCDSNFDSDFSLTSPSDIPGLELSPTLNCSSGETYCPIEGGLIVLNVDTSDESNIANFSQTLVSVVVSHELGHALGFGHSADISALMYYNATDKTTLKLAQDDANAAAYLYPRNEVGGSGVFGCGSMAMVGGSAFSDRGSKGGSGNGPNGSGSGQAEFMLLFSAIFAVLIASKLSFRLKSH